MRSRPDFAALVAAIRVVGGSIVSDGIEPMMFLAVSTSESGRPAVIQSSKGAEAALFRSSTHPL